MQRSTFKILFYIKKSAIKSNGKAAVMARVTVDGEAVQFSLKCEISPDEWNQTAGKAIGRSASALQMNGLLDNVRASLINHYREIADRDAHVTAEKVRNAFLGLDTKNTTLLEIFDKHCEDLRLQVGKKGVSKDSYQKYARTRTRVAEFLKDKYNLSDISLKELNLSFLCDFEIYLRTHHNCGVNTTAKFMQYVRTIILIAKNNGWLHADPFANYKFHTEKTERAFLTEKEMERIMQKEFDVKRLEQVRDIFIFSCFCGLAYIDIAHLTTDNIRTGFDDNAWIIGERKKTGVKYRVPLLEVPAAMIEKYRGAMPNGLLLPVISNQKMNAYLKEIADVCGIDKKLSFHVARHSFATLTLTKGVSIESVSKMLGHTNIKTTQIYARITDNKISDEMHNFAGKVGRLEHNFLNQHRV